MPSAVRSLARTCGWRHDRISPDEKRRREHAERGTAAERQPAERKGKRTSRSKRTSNGADQPPPNQPPPESEDAYGERAPHIDCEPRSLENNGESIAAVIDILRNHPAWRGVLAFDRFSLRIMLMRPLPRTGPQTPPAQWAPQDHA